jgi:hypothetical protein
MLIKALLLYLLLFNQGFANEDVLAGIAARLIKTDITQGDFHQQKQLKVLRKPLIATGAFTYHQSKGVIWKTLTPVVSLLLGRASKRFRRLSARCLRRCWAVIWRRLARVLR